MLCGFTGLLVPWPINPTDKFSFGTKHQNQNHDSNNKNNNDSAAAVNGNGGGGGAGSSSSSGRMCPLVTPSINSEVCVTCDTGGVIFLQQDSDGSDKSVGVRCVTYDDDDDDDGCNRCLPITNPLSFSSTTKTFSTFSLFFFSFSTFFFFFRWLCCVIWPRLLHHAWRWWRCLASRTGLEMR